MQGIALGIVFSHCGVHCAACERCQRAVRHHKNNDFKLLTPGRCAPAGESV